MEALAAHGERALATRVSPEQAEALRRKFPSAIHNPLGRTVRLAPVREPSLVGTVAVVTAGTSDRPVAEEAVETLRWMECNVELLVDIGVAGPKRLLQQKHRFEAADAVVVIAGMEGALALGRWGLGRLSGDCRSHERRLRGELRRDRGLAGNAQQLCLERLRGEYRLRLQGSLRRRPDRPPRPPPRTRGLSVPLELRGGQGINTSCTHCSKLNVFHLAPLFVGQSYRLAALAALRSFASTTKLG